jgi:hypothetical protein
MAQDMKGFVDPAAPEATANLSEQNRMLREQIGLGMDMEVFMRSDVGRLLNARANSEIKNLRAAFDSVDLMTPEGVAEARRIQQDIAVRKVWREWIELAIHEGEAAQAEALERGEL